MNNFRGEGFSKHPIYGSKRQFLASYMYLGRWRHSWPGLEDLARTNKLAARSETGHVSWLISGRIRFPFVHATLPSSASSRSGFPFTFGNLNFWRSAMPRLPPIFRIAAMMIPECSSIFVFLAFFLFFFFFHGRDPWTLFLFPREQSNWKYWRASIFRGVIGEDYEVFSGGSNWEMIGLHGFILYIVECFLWLPLLRYF